MTEAKKYLLQIQKLDKLIENKLLEAEHWRLVATGITTVSDSERVQSSGSKHKMEDAVCRYLTMEQEIDEAIGRLIDKKQEIIETIEQLEVIEYDVLHKKYVQFKEWYEIADDLNKSYSWVITVHGKALANVQKILNKKAGE